jgi:hypothetical protein
VWAQSSAAGLELSQFELSRSDEGLNLSFATRFELPAAVQDTLHKGTALHFVAEAEVFRSRWYWRDEKLSSVNRTWRLSFQPLTRKYRVSFGALNQSFDQLDQALAAVRQMSEWRVAEARDLADGKLYVEFSYRLDTSLLPRPLQIGVLGQSDWTLKLDHVQRLP